MPLRCCCCHLQLLHLRVRLVTLCAQLLRLRNHLVTLCAQLLQLRFALAQLLFKALHRFLRKGGREGARVVGSWGQSTVGTPRGPLPEHPSRTRLRSAVAGAVFCLHLGQLLPIF